jgi:hypothetical protein
MNSIYRALNDAQVNPEDYSVEQLSAFEKKAMKQGFRRRAGLTGKTRTVRWAAAAACLVCLISFSQTAFAQAAISNILQSINLGHSAVIQINPSQESKPDLSGYYDKNGKPLTSINPNGTTEVYDVKGNKVGSVKLSGKEGSYADPNLVTEEEKDLNKAVSQLSFKPLLPKGLPAEYAFDKAVLSKDDNGKLSGDYIDLYYTGSSGQIEIQERKLSTETTVATATDATVQKATVNGHAAAVTDGRSIDWEENGTFLSISAQALSTEELTKLAESMK